MNKKIETWNNIGKKIINELLVLAKDTKSFVAKQIPDVLKQLLLFKTLEYSIYAFLHLLVFILIAVTGYRMLAFLFGMEAFWIKILSFLLSFALIAWIGSIFCDMGQKIIIMLKIIVSPKIYLIEFLNSWAKQNIQNHPKDENEKEKKYFSYFER